MIFHDIKDTLNGDIDVTFGDFCLATTEETDRQDINWRIRTDNPDHYIHQTIGASLEDYRGDPNTEETGLKIEQAIKKALCQDERFSLSAVDVRAVPVSINEIKVIVLIKSSTKQQDAVIVTDVFNLGSGLS